MQTIGLPVSRLAGYAPALPTPFDDNDRIDFSAFSSFCDRQIQLGANALVVCGTTGEAPTLSRAEQQEIVRTAAGIARGRIPIIAGAGSNSTSQAVELARDAERAGADSLLCVVPYYNKPTQTGLYAHFSAIANSVGLPIILYDVPSRTGCFLADETIVRLAQHKQFIGLKDATGNLARPQHLRALLGPEFRLLSGDDASAMAFVSQGGNGCISVTSNVAPGLCRGMYLAFRQGETARAQRLAAVVGYLTAVLFRETNPAPVKYALHLMNAMSARVRLPLVAVTDETKAEIALALAQTYNCYSEQMIGEPGILQKVEPRVLKKVVAG